MTAAFGALDWWTGYEVSILALYMVPPALAGWHAGRRWAVVMAALGAAAWLAADVLAGHPYSHPLIPYWNAAPRLAIFAAFGILAGELRAARERVARGPDEDSLPAAGSFYRMLEREHGRLRRQGAPLTLAYVDAGGVRAEAIGTGEAFSSAVLEALRRSLRGTDVVARPRGKEFAVLLADTGPDAAAVALRRLQGVLQALAERHGTAFCVAIGAVSCTGRGGDVNQVIQRAYQLMYQAERAPGAVALSHEAVSGSTLPEPDPAV